MRTKNSWGTVIYDKKRHAYRARYQNPHKPGAVVQRVFSDRLTAQGWLAKEKQLVEADRRGLGSWTHPSEREAEAKARMSVPATVFRDYATSMWRIGGARTGSRSRRRRNASTVNTSPICSRPRSSVRPSPRSPRPTSTSAGYADGPHAAVEGVPAAQGRDAQGRARGLITASPETMRNPKLPRSSQAQIPVATPQELKIIYENMPEYCRIRRVLGRMLRSAHQRGVRVAGA